MHGVFHLEDLIETAGTYIFAMMLRHSANLAADSDSDH
jgi:hypothetical protein